MEERSIYIALATTDFALYQDITKELRAKGLKFVTITPDEPIGGEIGVVITSAKEASGIDFHNVVIASDPETAVNQALRLLRDRAPPQCVIVGIDPGEEPGIAVVANDIVEAVYRVPLKQTAEIIQKVKQEYSDIIVRIGHGARLAGIPLANTLIAQGVNVELVNERGTSPYLGKGTAGIGVADIVAAINIAHTHGASFVHQNIVPSRGEIRQIQEKSRERSKGRTTISRKLAERVAKGEMTLDDALTEHMGTEEDKTV
ncbi:MAG: hypothetical protein ACXV3T_07175 [Halobacteriota archaeon]